MIESTVIDEGALSSDAEDRILRAMQFPTAPKAPPQKQPPKAAPQAPQTPAPQDAEPQDAPNPTDAPQDAEPVEAVAEAPEDNLIEVDFKGNKYKLPTELKELHDGYLRQEDYTRKTQEVAEQRKVLDLHTQQAHAQQALQQAVQPYVERLVTLNNQLSQWEKVDWTAYMNQDFQQAMAHRVAFEDLKAGKARLEQEMQGAAAQHVQKLKDSTDNLRKENSKILAEKVKGWTQERDKSVRDFASKTYGFSDQELSGIFDARLLRLMNDAKDLHDLRAAKPVKQATPPAKTLKPSGVQTQDANKAKEAELKRSLRSQKTESGAAKVIQQILERRM